MKFSLDSIESLCSVSARNSHKNRYAGILARTSSCQIFLGLSPFSPLFPSFSLLPHLLAGSTHPNTIFSVDPLLPSPHLLTSLSLFLTPFAFFCASSEFSISGKRFSTALLRASSTAFYDFPWTHFFPCLCSLIIFIYFSGPQSMPHASNYRPTKWKIQITSMLALCAALVPPATFQLKHLFLLLMVTFGEWCGSKRYPSSSCSLG